MEDHSSSRDSSPSASGAVPSPKAQHTPGPWSVGDVNLSLLDGVIGETAIHAACVDSAFGYVVPAVALPFTDDDEGRSVAAANALLIASAPDLRETLVWIALFADMRSQDDSKVFARVSRGALRTIRDKARAAIRLATGEA